MHWPCLIPFNWNIYPSVSPRRYMYSVTFLAAVLIMMIAHRDTFSNASMNIYIYVCICIRAFCFV